jgi:pimeloyl-ACP methyl ester carboxylesterase
VGILHFRVRHFADLILEAIRALEIEPAVILGHSFGGQLAALVAEEMGAGALQPIFINPALGTPWDLKLRLCWRRPWLFFKLIEELGYDDGNIAKGELYHAGRLLLSTVDMLFDRNLRPFRRLQATMALLLNRDTTSILSHLTNLGIRPIVVQGILDQSTPPGDGAQFVDGFHSWLQEANGPQDLLAALMKVLPRPAAP